MAISLNYFLIVIIFWTFLLSIPLIVFFFLWLFRRAVVGKAKAKYTNAIVIIVIGSIIGTIVPGGFFPGGLVIQFIVWLFLVKRLFDYGWLKAVVIAIVATIMFLIIVTTYIQIMLSNMPHL